MVFKAVGLNDMQGSSSIKLPYNMYGYSNYPSKTNGSLFPILCIAYLLVGTLVPIVLRARSFLVYLNIAI